MEKQKKAHDRTAANPQGQTVGKTHLDNQRQIRNAGTNRAQGKGDHMHRGDRRDMQPQK